MQPSQAEAFLRSTTSRLFLRRYKWGVNLRTSSLPIAYILLKQKKDFKAARPIISYVHFLYAKLFRATAIALDLILRCVCPRSFGLDTLPSILQKMTVFLQQLPFAKFVDGHLASPLSLMSFSGRLQHILQYSMDSQLFPNLHHYISRTWPVVDRWLRHHNIFTVDYEQWRHFVSTH